MENGFKSEVISVNGSFYTRQECDETTVFTDFNTLARLMNMEGKANSVEIYVKSGNDLRKTRKNIASLVGDDFIIKDIFQQQATLYHIMHSEKWAVYLVLAFILILSTFNVAGSLSMLIIDKRKDIEIFSAMGGDKRFNRKIFLYEGLLIAIAGGIIGLVLGILTVWLQQEFGFVKFGSGGGSYIIDTYPVALRISDIIAILATLITVGFCSSALTVRIALRKLAK
jgi:lipoprotein-releasing system permease protein